MRRLLYWGVLAIATLGASAPGRAQTLVGETVLGSGFETATAPKIDFIVIADNSASMAAELAAMEQALQGLAPSLAAGDFRLIVLARHGGGSLAMCVTAPLSGTIDCTQAPQPAVRFAHYDVGIGSTDALCVLLRTLPPASSGGQPDGYGRFPHGLLSLLRNDAFKSILVLSDDRVNCSDGAALQDGNTAVGGDTAATAFETALFAVPGQYFGTAQARRYALFHVGGQVQADADPDVPWLPADPVVINKCVAADTVGPGYQQLARRSGGYRWSLCATDRYPSFLTLWIARSVALAF